MGFTLGTTFNSGTDWEFTVSQETLAEVVAGGGITEADIADYCYVALIDARVVAMVAESTRSSNDGLYPWAMGYCAAYNTNNGAHPSKVQMNISQKEQNPVTCYQRNIITYYGTIGGKSGHFLVMDMVDIKKWIMDYDVYPAYVAGSVTSTAGFPGYSGTCYVYNEANVARLSAYQPVGTPTENLFLMNVFNDGNDLWVGSLNPTAHSKELISNEKLSHAAWEFDFAAADIYNTYYTGYIYQGSSPALQGWSNFPDAEFPEPSGNTTIFASYLECDDSCDSIICVKGQYGHNSNPYITQCEQGKIVKTLHGLHTIESWGGLLFKDNNVVYKPIIEGGLVVGFTSDMDIPSEWDDMTNVTGNNISPTPPVPPTPSGEDDMESQTLGATGSSGGFTKFFVMSSQNLSDFLTDFYARADSGETLSNNLVCSYILGVPSSDWCATESIPITINNSAQGTPFVSAANYSHVIATNNYIVAGNIEVPRKTGTFYDFAPYSTYELFIPCCGWITLPDTVAGRHIYVSIQIDIATCGAKGVVKFDDGATCAVCSGVLGSNIPMQIIESGLLRGANVQAASSALGGALMAGSGFGNGNVGLGLNGISNVVNAFTQSAIAGNTNYTNQKGTSGDITQFAMGHNCYLKITYPPVDEVVNNSMFGHTVGYLCEEVGSLSSFHGFTVCANPHVHINATSTERDEITQLLEQGVILPNGE